MNETIVQLLTAGIVLLVASGIGYAYAQLLKKDAKADHYGSLSWIVYVANILKGRLVGIELTDNSENGVSVSPPVQIRFIVPSDYGTVHPSVLQVAKLKGYRGTYPVWRGKGDGKMLQMVTFDFYKRDEDNYPAHWAIIVAAALFGFVYAPRGLNKNKPNGNKHTARLSLKLYI